MNITFEEFVRGRVDKGECAVGHHMHVHTTEAMLKYIASHITSQQINRTFIYNYEDDKCYYFYNDKLYRLSVNFEEVDI